MQVLFVCTGNTCRSPMAASLFNHLCHECGLDDIEIASAGLAASNGTPISHNARLTLDGAGVTVHNQTSQALTTRLVAEADLIATMTHSHCQAIQTRHPDAVAKVKPLLAYARTQSDVTDPFGGDLEEYQDCLKSMTPGLKALLEKLKEDMSR